MNFCDNFKFNNIISILIQIIFIFSFLCIFYFSYVVRVESIEFTKQLNLIVDNLINSIKNTPDILNNKNLPPNLPPNLPINLDEINVIIDGSIDVLETKITKSSQEAIDAININNNKIKFIVTIIIIILFMIIMILFIVFKCLPFYTISKESIITVIFIGFTEFIFLTYVSSKYISADPNKVKTQLGLAIHNFIVNNKLN